MSFNLEPLSRRAVLRGLGVSMCLPLLEAMEPATVYARSSAGRAASVAARKPPVRLAALYMPNGVNPKAWKPTGYGSDFELSSILAPLSNVKSDILVFTELMNHQSLDGDGHYYKVAPFLTGTHISRTTGSNLRCGGVSLDQIIAQRVGDLTPLPSLELSIEPVTDGVDTNVGLTRLYGSHISWSSPTTPVTREINPQQAFDRLFRQDSTAAVSPSAPGEKDRSVLDLVMSDARRLQQTVGVADRAKLDEYFDSVRAVETRIAFDAARRRGEVMEDPRSRAAVEKLGDRIRDFYKVPEGKRGIDHTEQVRLMLDIQALAFWTDSTRVSTFMFANEVSGKNFSFLPGVSGGHHEISHHSNDPAKLEQYRLINIWHLQQYAYLLERMKSMTEGDSNVLDNSMVMLGSGMKDGNAHDPHNIPIVLAGKAGGTLATGRHLTYPKNTPLCDLYKGMLARAGCPVEKFGDSDAELPGLSDPSYTGLKS